MQDSKHGNGSVSAGASYDAVIVGASLAGCTTAILLGRAGARVALVEKQRDPKAYKRICSHFIQSSAVPALERLDLLRAIEDAGGTRPYFRAWTRWGWIEAPKDRSVASVNLRRELLDPLVRETAAAVPGVDLLLGQTAQELTRGTDGAVSGVVVRDTSGTETRLGARLTIGADGRDSHIADLARVPVKTTPHGRFAYGGYFEGPPPAGAPDASVWMLDPQFAAAFPTDSGLVFYIAMGTKDRLPEFRRDLEAALVKWVADLPDAPPIRESRLVDRIKGKLDMTNKLRRPVAPGLALVGDAALAIDPLWGVGCGFAFQSGEWLADSVTPALLRGESLDAGLERYRKRHARGLNGHARMMVQYATGRKFDPSERLLFAATARDEELVVRFDAFASRRIGPVRALATTVPRAILVNTRNALRRGSGAEPVAASVSRGVEHEREQVAA
ncbi:MAG TPA: NAD(P)/FAD-dependent oxidoreductase [Conexibacter sp.]|jgi:2-polyprenyl-6-methoxyphenol hydroxylase-like FAD-dependent oxidoreductase|nr:NAD(P)/FAD-dependent oxidoreductase [Conexibacter sp.]